MPKSLTYNADCLEMMREMDDNAYDLAIVDPPYGILTDITSGGPRSKFNQIYRANAWTDEKPSAEYFNELRRVSHNQIICGGNYFADLLPPTRGWIIWDKEVNGVTTINNELLYSSFSCALRTFRRCHGLDKGFMLQTPNIHPTQKPVALYKWLLTNYAKQGDTILDTHLGSGSSRIAAYDLGFDFTGIELDQDYFNAQEARFAEHIKQPTFWEQPKAEPMQLTFAV